MPNKHISTIRIYRGQQEESSHAQGRIRTISGHSWWIDSSTQLLSGRWRSSRKRESDGIRPERRDKNQLKRIGYNGKNIRKKTRKKNEMSQLPFFFFLKKKCQKRVFWTFVTCPFGADPWVVATHCWLYIKALLLLLLLWLRISGKDPSILFPHIFNS